MQSQKFTLNDIKIEEKGWKELILLNELTLLQRYAKSVCHFEKQLTEQILPLVQKRHAFLPGKFPTLDPHLFRLFVLKQTDIQISQSHASRILSHQISAKVDKQPLNALGSYQVRRYQRRIYIVTPAILSPAKLGTISASIPCEITLRPNLKKHRHTLKRLFQTFLIPPWERDHIPIFFNNDMIIAIWGIFIHPEYKNFVAHWPSQVLVSENIHSDLSKEQTFQYNNLSKEDLT